MFKSFLAVVGCVISVLLFNSCNSGSSTQETAAEASAPPEPSTPVDEMGEFRFSFTIANMPPPLQVLDEFSKAGLPANTGLLNSANNLDQYHTSNKKALNFGIYGIDLAYAVFNERTPEVLIYYPAVKRLAGDLDLAEPFNRYTVRFQENQNNRDSLARMVDDVYTATDSYLRSNERLMTASVILAGSWLEAQHITVNSLLNVNRTPENEALFQRVWEQRFHLENIAKTLESFQDDTGLAKLRDVYLQLLETYKEPSDPKDVNQEFLTRLAQKIEVVRSHAIAG